MKRVIVTGGRMYAQGGGRQVERDRLWLALDELAHDALIVVGDAHGADAAAREWARLTGRPCEVHTADWRRLGRAAGPERNGRMVRSGADLLVAFPGGRGTANCIRQARAAGIPVIDLST